MKSYIGIKMVKAEPCEKDGVHGYTIVYPDGYESWSPAAVFEAAYLPVKNESRLSKEDVQRLIYEGTSTHTFSVSKGQSCTSMSVSLPFGWSESCIATPSINAETHTDAREQEKAWCEERLFDTVFEHMHFAFLWARNGIRSFPCNQCGKK